MNTALATTVTDLANLGKPRAAQSVHVCSRGGKHWRAVVLVTPDGAPHGEYYEIFSRLTLAALEAGRTPEELELEPFEGDDEPEPFGGDYCHADNFRALLRGTV